MVVFWRLHILCNGEVYSLGIQSGKMDETAATTPRMISFSGAETGVKTVNCSHLNIRENNTLSFRKTNHTFLEAGATPSQRL